MAKIIVLAKSIKLGGTCIAGIDYDTHEWIRPIRKGDAKSLPSRLSMNLLDIVDIQFLNEKPHIKYQKENRFIDLDKEWRLVGKVEPEYIERYCENTKMILHSNTAEVDPKELDALPFEKWISLMLIKPEEIHFNDDRFRAKHWRAFIQYNNNSYDMKITDLDVCNKLNRGEEINHNCALTISLPSPWVPPSGKKEVKCYKLIAGLIEI